LKVWVVVLFLFILVGSSLSCGQNDTQAAEGFDLDHLDRIVPRLTSGLSVGEVEERLGEPEAKFETEGSETVLTYRLWRVVFHPSLYMRIRRYVEGFRRANGPVGPLDRKVRALKLGSSVRTVERKLGKTVTWQILTFSKDEYLWYGRGRWKLHILNRRLVGKALYA